jgi:hypothetical protein
MKSVMLFGLLNANTSHVYFWTGFYSRWFVAAVDAATSGVVFVVLGLWPITKGLNLSAPVFRVSFIPHRP